VISAETAYARKLGFFKLKKPAIDDIAAIEDLREAIAAVVGALGTAHPWCPTAGPRVTLAATATGMATFSAPMKRTQFDTEGRMST
jgi:hypothetical protein